MKMLLVPFVVAVASCIASPEANGQVVIMRGAWNGLSSGGVAASSGAGFVAPSYGPAAAQAYSSGYMPPYSYWASYPLPGRIYLGYGNYDFPFYGRPYGYPYDAWSWTYLGDPHRGLARHYYPPLR
jgi:hypothetical protein